MAYRNKVYVSFDADNDMKYYRTLQMWDANDDFEFTFNDAHDINTILDKSEESIKAGLMERFRNTKIFVLLVGQYTKNLYKYVRWEIEQAIKTNTLGTNNKGTNRGVRLQTATGSDTDNLQ